MFRQFLLGKIHRATITRANLDYVGSITLDPLLIQAAGFLEHEKVEIYDVTNGARLSTYVIPGEIGSGEVGINGAAAHLVHAGDVVIVANYGFLTGEEIRDHAPNIVFVDDRNRVVTKASQERNLATAQPFA